MSNNSFIFHIQVPIGNNSIQTPFWGSPGLWLENHLILVVQYRWGWLPFHLIILCFETFSLYWILTNSINSSSCESGNVICKDHALNTSRTLANSTSCFFIRRCINLRLRSMIAVRAYFSRTFTLRALFTRLLLLLFNNYYILYRVRQLWVD